jgi:hypothetical protein
VISRVPQDRAEVADPRPHPFGDSPDDLHGGVNLLLNAVHELGDVLDDVHERLPVPVGILRTIDEEVRRVLNNRPQLLGQPARDLRALHDDVAHDVGGLLDARPPFLKLVGRTLNQRDAVTQEPCSEPVGHRQELRADVLPGLGQLDLEPVHLALQRVGLIRRGPTELLPHPLGGLLHVDGLAGRVLGVYAQP